MVEIPLVHAMIAWVQEDVPIHARDFILRPRRYDRHALRQFLGEIHIFNLIRSLSGTSSFSNDTVPFTAVSAHACYNGNFGI